MIRKKSIWNGILLCFLVAIVYCGIFWTIEQQNYTFQAVGVQVSYHFQRSFLHYFVKNKNCVIPKLDPWDASIWEIVKDTVTSNCKEEAVKPDLTYSDTTHIFVNQSVLHLYKEFYKCQLKEIHRKAVSDDDEYLYGKTSVYFTESITVKVEFVKVSCYTKSDRFLYSNFHAFAPPKPSVEERCNTKFRKHKESGQSDEYFNVLAMGVDSVSQLNFHRKFVKTRHYLMNKLGAIEMYGYTKVADNTFVNLTPLLEGQFIEETGWDEGQSGVPFDKHNLLWKNFSNAGYRTLLAEDDPDIATWNYLKSGFGQQPTDYYYRPFALAVDKKFFKSDDRRCFGQRSETKMVLDYVFRFVNTFQSKPFFSFAFLTGATHSEINYHTDDEHLEFVQSVFKTGLLSNTFLIYFSDHGMRYGSIVEHYIGKIEERMPAMYIVPPKDFLEKYPEMWNNLKFNGHQLTTPFDIYEFLKNILYFKPVVKNIQDQAIPRGISLLNRIPETRTCKNAGVDDHWCPCLLKEPVSSSSQMVIGAAKKLVRFINKKLYRYPQCSKLRLKSIKDVLASKPSGKLLSFVKSENEVINKTVFYGDSVSDFLTNCLVTIETIPGHALFESTVQHKNASKQYSVIGDISRINAYGHQSDCVQSHSIKKFCFCKAA